MSYPREQIVYLTPEDSNGFDIGNTGANVATIVIPVKCHVLRAFCWSNTAVANSFTVSMDSYTSGNTQGAADLANIVVPDSASAFGLYFDDAGRAVELEAGERALVQVDEAGDSGEVGFVGLLVEYLPEIDNNESQLTETA
ncbi:MAG: hypothetical protein ACW99U_17895 [Candidatus Thorarchaeota archaeon]|jgi:hypothetical protein